MPKHTYDIQMRFIPDDTRCYILFPGRAYNHYFEMNENEVVFLDFPGLPLSNTDFNNPISDWEARITVSDRIRRWFSQGQDQSDLPSRTVAELGSFRSSKRKNLFAGLLNSFFKDLKKGDLVIVPPPEQNGDVLFGELIDHPNSFVHHPHPEFLGEKVAARKIRWISKVKRRDVPRWLDSKLPSPNPLRLIERSFYAQIFDLSYERYFYQDNYVCKFNITSENFDALTNLYLQQFVLLPTALHFATKNPEIDSLYQLIRKNVSHQNAPDQRIEINSPGHIILIARNAAPIAAAIFLIMTTESQATSNKPQNIKIANSSQSLQSKRERECLIDIESEVDNDLTMMNHKQWKEACELGISSKNETGLNTGARSK